MKVDPLFAILHNDHLFPCDKALKDVGGPQPPLSGSKWEQFHDLSLYQATLSKMSSRKCEQAKLSNMAF